MLKKLSIEYYKGFYEQQSIEFSIPNRKNEGSGLTLIVGPNNTGKTTIINVLVNLFHSNLSFIYIRIKAYMIGIP
jgi:DNA repair exonuclease SbcCD ATPase subunit